jgi:hypothetical protein
MTYMYSLNATANQQTTLLVDFDLKTDPNMDLILTQSRQQLLRYRAPHLSARGTSTLQNNALLSTHFRLADNPGARSPGLFDGTRADDEDIH